MHRYADLDSNTWDANFLSQLGEQYFRVRIFQVAKAMNISPTAVLTGYLILGSS